MSVDEIEQVLAQMPNSFVLGIMSLEMANEALKHGDYDECDALLDRGLDLLAAD